MRWKNSRIYCIFVVLIVIWYIEVSNSIKVAALKVDESGKKRVV